MTSKDLTAAVELFNELGWQRAKMKHVASLPLGTPEQQQRAKRGLSKGQWMRQSTQPPFESISRIGDANPLLMTLFALRLGVAPKRIVQLLRQFNTHGNHRLIAQLIGEHGTDYATGFIKEAATISHTASGSWLFIDDDFNTTSFFLLTQYFPDLPVPLEENYLLTWSFLAANALGIPDVTISSSRDSNPTRAEIMPTFVEHLHACLELQLPLWEVIGQVAMKALAMKKVEREKVVAAAFYSLDGTTRPGQRRRMIEILNKELKVTDAEIRTHWELLTGCLAMADSLLISAFGERAVSLAAPTQIADLVLPMLYVTTFKGQKEVLSYLQQRTDIPSEACTVLEPRITELATSTDKKVASLAKNLLQTWGKSTEVASISDSVEFYPWNEPPKLWNLPRFERIEPTYDALLAALSSSDYTDESMYREPNDVTTTESEQCLVAFTQLAFNDPEAAQRLTSVTENHPLWYLAMRSGEPELHLSVVLRPLSAIWQRNIELQHAMGSIPCLVSEPSFIDLSISFDDLLDRLDTYEAAEASVLYSDLLVALTRLNLDDIDFTTADAAARKRGATVLHLSHPTERPAGVILADYLTDPYSIPKLIKGSSPFSSHPIFQPGDITTPNSLGEFLDPIADATRLDPGAIPRWGDPAWTQLRHRASATNADQGLLARQVARSANPLGPGTTMNLIGLARPTKKGGISLAHQAITDAWERGLLLPGVADPQFLDWDASTTKSYNSLVPIAQELAELGMLAIAWQLLDSILAQATKPTAKTAEVADMMLHLAPSVAQAIVEGKAATTNAAVPHLRKFADAHSKSKTTIAACQAVALLPDVTADSSQLPAAPDLTGWNSPAPKTIYDHLDLYLTQATTNPTAVAVGVKASTDKSLQLEINPWGLELLPTTHFFEVEGYRANEFHCYYILCWNGSTWDLQVGQGQHPNRSDLPKRELPIFASVVYILFGSMHSGSRSKNALEAMQTFLDQRKISAELIAYTIRRLVAEELWTPTQALKLVQRPKHLSILWPLLTETIAAAAEKITAGITPPKWLGQVLTTINAHATILKAATTAGYIPHDAWKPLSIIAGQNKKNATTTRAQELLKVFGGAAL